MCEIGMLHVKIMKINGLGIKLKCFFISPHSLAI
jgi:hypothetical protein